GSGSQQGQQGQGSGSNQQGQGQGSNQQGSGQGQGSQQQQNPQQGQGGQQGSNQQQQQGSGQGQDQQGQPQRPNRGRTQPKSPDTPSDQKLDDLENFSRRLQRDEARRRATGRSNDPLKDW
ncbi:MAG: hypothetical protein H0T65_10560, partial [Deltaproteobacteria bacterium]|nr:hypothetical protein [Deltaproteobacteria bacterium]